MYYKIKFLLSLYNSPYASPVTSSVMPFDNAERATLLLRMCPDTWQNLYDLTQDSVLQRLQTKLLAVLENIEKCKNSAGANLKLLPTANGPHKPNRYFDKSSPT